MTSVEALARVTKATGRPGRRPSRIGEGDPCPIEPKHGAMLVLRSAAASQEPRQYCCHVAHQPKRGPQERVFWPFDIEPSALRILATTEVTRLAHVRSQS